MSEPTACSAIEPPLTWACGDAGRTANRAQLAALTHYVPRQVTALAALPLASLLAGEVRFAPLEAT